MKYYRLPPLLHFGCCAAEKIEHLVGSCFSSFSSCLLGWPRRWCNNSKPFSGPFLIAVDLVVPVLLQLNMECKYSDFRARDCRIDRTEQKFSIVVCVIFLLLLLKSQSAPTICVFTALIINCAITLSVLCSPTKCFIFIVMTSSQLPE